MRAAFLVVLLSGSAWAEEAPDPDEVSAKLSRGKTIDSCLKAYGPARRTFPAAYLRGINMEAETCTKRVMNVTVDQVLVPLKKTDTVRFKLGMDAQRSFNEAVKRYCGRWEPYYERCCSTCSFTESSECAMDFHSVRTKQVEDALAKKVPPESPAAARVRTNEFESYAITWCAFLTETGFAVDGTCVSRVLGALEAGQRDDGAEKKCGKK